MLGPSVRMMDKLEYHLLGINVLAQGHNAVTPVRLGPTTLQPRVKRSTTEPLRSLLLCDFNLYISTLIIG